MEITLDSDRCSSCNSIAKYLNISVSDELLAHCRSQRFFVQRSMSEIFPTDAKIPLFFPVIRIFPAYTLLKNETVEVTRRFLGILSSKVRKRTSRLKRVAAVLGG